MKSLKNKRRPSLRNPEWWTSIAVDLVDIKLGSLAKNLSKLLVTEELNIEKQIIGIYEEAFNACTESIGISVKVPSKFKENHEVMSFDPAFPTNFFLIDVLINEVITNINSNGDAGDIKKDEIVLVINTRFGEALNLIRSTKSDKYEALNKYIEIIEDGYNTPQGQLVEHTNEILYRLSKSPLPIDNSLTLWDIYISPSVLYTSENSYEPTYEKNIIELILSKIGDGVLPIVVHGQPGHGKTSTMRMLTHAICAKERLEGRNNTNVLMYEFKNLGVLNESEIKVLSRVTPFIEHKDFFMGKNTVLILDGLDERQITDGNDFALREFVRHMFDLSSELNENKEKTSLLFGRKQEKTKFNLILTGRSQFVNQIKPAFNSAYHSIEIQDFSKEQVGTWLKKYCSRKDSAVTLNYGDFESKKLNDLIHQPILLTISSLMLIDKIGIELLSSLDNVTLSRGDIYRTIVKWTYHKKWQHQPNKNQLPSEDIYNKFLETTALVLLRSGKESIKVRVLLDEIKKNRKFYQLESVGFSDLEDIESIFKNLSVSFFFKGIEDNAFSFIHKSIKDYLASAAIINLLLETIDIFREDRIEKSCDSMAKDIYMVLGKMPLSNEDHLPFIRDILLHNPIEAEKLVKPLSCFFNFAKDHRYLVNSSNDMNDNPLLTEANVLSSLLYVLTEALKSGRDMDDDRLDTDVSGIFDEEEDLHKFASLINATGIGRFSSHNFNLSFARLKKSNFSGVKMTGTSLADKDMSEVKLERVDFSGSDLRRVNMSSSEFNEIDLSKTNLKAANLCSSVFNNVDLSSADLSEADLSECVFNNVDLSSSNLSRSNMSKVKFYNVKLEGAKLDGSVMNDLGCSYSNLQSTSFVGVDLSCSVIKHTDLHCSNFETADLRNSRISHSDFSGSSFISAIFSHTNVRHSKLNNSDFRSVKFDSTNISYSDLNNSILEGVDLSKVKFLGVENLEL